MPRATLVIDEQSPCIVNAMNCLVTLFINVYTAQGGRWSDTAKASVAVVTSLLVGALAVFSVYQFWYLRKARVAYTVAIHSTSTVHFVHSIEWRARASISIHSISSTVIASIHSIETCVEWMDGYLGMYLPLKRQGGFGAEGDKFSTE